MGLSLTKHFSGLFGKTKVMKIALAGLTGVGKTTILYKLKLGVVVSTVATINFNMETLEYNNISFSVWDIPGCEMRDMWKHFFYDTQALMYVIDSTDRDRADEAKDQLHTMLNRDELKDAVVLVFANKQDGPNAMNSDEIIKKFELHTISQRHWHIQNTCATSGEGLYEGLDWLSNIIIKPIESN